MASPARGWLGRALGASIVLVAVSLGTAGCAYYNTFYFARKYYGQAEKLTAAAGSDKVPPEASRKYDDAIKQSTKVLKYHSHSRWVDDALYLIGASFYGKRDFEEALRKFDELTTNYPDSRWVPWALYRSGLCQYELKNDEQMSSCFQRVMKEHPKFERTDDILYTEARAAERRRDRVEAVRRYRELVQRYPRSERGQEGLLRIGDLYFDAGFADSAYASYDEASRLARDDTGIRDAEVKSSDALVRLERAPEAVRQLERLLPRDETQMRAGEVWPAQVRVHLAQAYNAADRPLDALAALRTVLAKYPQSSYAPEAQFQIGYTYEVYLDSLDAARTAYDQVSRTGGASAFREQAQVRSKNLAQLQTLSTQAMSDSAAGPEKQAEAQLKIAELFLLSQNKVPEAMAKYRSLRADYPHSRYAPRAAYALAWIRLKLLEGQRDSAIADFAQLVRDYPSSPAARGALDLLTREKADTSGLGVLVAASQPDSAEVDSASALPDTSALPDSARSARRGPAPPGERADSLGRGPMPGPGLPPRGRAGRPDLPSRPGVPYPDTIPSPPVTPFPDSLPHAPGVPLPDSSRVPPGGRLPGPPDVKPGAAQPDSVAPGASPPGTPPPGSTAPGSTAPGTTAPGTTAPGTTAPGTTAPGTAAPDRTRSSS